MANVKPFICIRPSQERAAQVAALPYDVYNRQEARKICQANPLSFLNIDRPETQFDPQMDMYAPQVYQKAADMLRDWERRGIFLRDEKPAFYLYALTMGERTQSGIVGCSAVDDYLSGVIKKHENTREEKELDRIRHVDITKAQTGPIFLAYRRNEDLAALIREEKKSESLYDFVSEDGIRHQVWRFSQERSEKIEKLFLQVPCTYIADGHHRAASAVKAGLKRRRENPGYTGEEEFNYFLSVLFAEDELKILPYNRVVKDLNGLTKEEFLKRAEEFFLVERPALAQGEDYEPKEKGSFGLYLDEEWYCLKARPQIRPEGLAKEDPVAALDVSLLQNYILDPILGIKDPRVDHRIDFVGGIRGTGELKRRVHNDMNLAFSMYPTSVEELFAVADQGLLMPPKSTWFEPKLRSGLFIHQI